MTNRSKRAVLVGAIVLVVGLTTQTPLFTSLRWRSWDWVVTLVGRLTGQVGISDTQQNQLDHLQSENVRLHAELADYARLKAQLGTPSFDGFKIIPAAIVGRPLDMFSSEFLLSRGAADGVTLGAPLVINGSTLIGFVGELHERSAVGRLLLNPQTTMTAEIAGGAEQKIQGLVVGDRYTALKLTTVPRDLPLKKDEPVVSSAKPDQLPSGLLIGTVARITNQQNAAYQEATLKLPYEPDQLSAVAILVVP